MNEKAIIPVGPQRQEREREREREIKCLRKTYLLEDTVKKM
jgi:hypothetical protein